MPMVVVTHRLKDFDTWFTQFKKNPPPDVGHWRVLRGADDPNLAQVIGEMTAFEMAKVKEFFALPHMQDVFKSVNAMSSAPTEIVWLHEA